MDAGFEVYDAVGNLKVSLGDKLFRFIGMIIVPTGGSGSIVNDGFLTGTPEAVCNMYDSGGGSYYPGDGLYGPDITFSGNTMYYSVNAAMPAQVIQYGVW